MDAKHQNPGYPGARSLGSVVARRCPGAENFLPVYPQIPRSACVFSEYPPWGQKREIPAVAIEARFVAARGQPTFSKMPSPALEVAPRRRVEGVAEHGDKGARAFVALNERDRRHMRMDVRLWLLADIQRPSDLCLLCL